MRAGVRKLALTVHIACSVGWLGAVAAALVLAIAGLASDDPDRVRAVYLTLELSSWYVLIPLAVASLLSGLVQALGTAWGLVRHYWVLIKLLMNLLATGVLLLYMQTLTHLADLARADAPVAQLRSPSPVLHAAGALVLLSVAVVLSVYKPRGRTRYGRGREAAAAQ